MPRATKLHFVVPLPRSSANINSISITKISFVVVVVVCLFFSLPANDDSSFVHDWKGWHVDMEPLLCRDGRLNGGASAVGQQLHAGASAALNPANLADSPLHLHLQPPLNLLHKNYFRGGKGGTETTGWKILYFSELYVYNSQTYS